MWKLSAFFLGSLTTCMAFAQGTVADSQPAAVAASQPASAPAPVPRAYDPPFGLNSKTMTGDWFGLRPALQDAGIATQFFYNNHFMSVLDGGKDTGGGKNSATYDWFITLDLDKMKIIKDADMLLHVRRGWGYSINPYAGTTKNQDVNDDADGWRDMYIDQLWYRQYFLDRKIALQFGYMDFQTVVDRNAYANSEDKQFMNTGLDNNPLIPTAAITSIGAALTIQPVEWYSLILAAGDAQGPVPSAPKPTYKPGFSTAFHDEAWFVSWLENVFSFKIPTPMGPLPGNYRLGMVFDPRPRAAYVPSWKTPYTRGDDYGFYASFDQMVFRENLTDDQGLGLFFRYAWRHDDINRFFQFWSTGLQYAGLIPERNKDVFGFGMTQLISSEDAQNSTTANRKFGDETVYEVYYAIQITPWLVISPDFQYVDNPGANGSISHAIVGGVRVRVSF